VSSTTHSPRRGISYNLRYFVRDATKDVRGIRGRQPPLLANAATAHNGRERKVLKDVQQHLYGQNAAVDARQVSGSLGRCRSLRGCGGFPYRRIDRAGLCRHGAAHRRILNQPF